MFLIVPLIILLSSLAGILVIVGRKFPYLKKLAPEIVENPFAPKPRFLSGLFPELAAGLKKVDPGKYKAEFLTEFEKFLRKFRLISLKIDTLTNKLINRVRHSTKKYQDRAERDNQLAESEKAARPLFHSRQNTLKNLKEEEQKLIIEIAKNPKDPALYKELGEVYLKTGELEDALESFKKALSLDSGDDEARSRSEMISGKLGPT